MNQETKAAWKIWTSNPCYSELISMIEDLMTESVADTDRISTPDLTVGAVAEQRGIRVGLKRLMDKIEDKL